MQGTIETLDYFPEMRVLETSIRLDEGWQGHQGGQFAFVTYEREPIDRLTAKAADANVRLHVLVDDRDGRLDGARLREAVPDWKSASIWFCGPKGFGEALRRDLLSNGLPPGDFHQELFNMR